MGFLAWNEHDVLKSMREEIERRKQELVMALESSLQGLDKTKKGRTTELFVRGVVGVAPTGKLH